MFGKKKREKEAMVAASSMSLGDIESVGNTSESKGAEKKPVVKDSGNGNVSEERTWLNFQSKRLFSLFVHNTPVMRFG